jgi:hypothetical protein
VRARYYFGNEEEREMNDRLTAEPPGTLEFLTDDDWIKMGEEILILGNPITYIPIMGAEELVADTLIIDAEASDEGELHWIPSPHNKRGTNKYGT